MSRPYGQIGGKNSTPAVGGNFEVDENIKAGARDRGSSFRWVHVLTRSVLPAGCRIIESIRYGTAAWTRAARISVILEDGQTKSYFMKV
jgi:hypothetical protein